MMNTNDVSRKLQRSLKCIADRGVAVIALAMLSPVLLAVAIAIYIRMGSPVLFAQPRPGKNGRIFTFYKFRTMTSDRCNFLETSLVFIIWHTPLLFPR